MFAKAKVIGIGERQSGTSKKGRPYEFVPMHFTYEDERTQGLVPLSANVYRQAAPESGYPKIGDEVEVFWSYVNGQPVVVGIR